MLKLILNEEHLSGVLAEALSLCRHRLFIATADVKNLHLRLEPAGGAGPARPRARSILEIFGDLCERGIEIRLLHSGVPSGPFLATLKDHKPRGLTMRRCPRAHLKACIVDGKYMYLGSANLTGAGLGAKSPRRRNFEAGIWTDRLALIDPMLDMLDAIWNGRLCETCGRKAVCPVPLEEPQL